MGENKNYFDVTALGGTAGGLVGVATGGSITQSYSTCSVNGSTVGGFAGSAASVTDCYATGRVLGTTTEGAFAASLTGTATDCHYFEIINARDNADHPYLTALGGNAVDTGITAIDADAASYNTFVGDPANWGQAEYYDTARTDYYQTSADTEDNQARYTFPTVAQLGASLQHEADGTDADGNAFKADFVSVHRGDWPAPETYFENTK